MRKKKRILVSGHVQGVGFRHYTFLLAQKYNMNGWVRNLKNGRVETLISGEERQMQLFIADLKIGPPSSSVSHLKIEDKDRSFSQNQMKEENGFKIKETVD